MGARVLDPRDPYGAAQEFLEASELQLVAQSKIVYEWQDGCYRELPSPTLRSLLYAFLAECEIHDKGSETTAFKPTRNFVSSVEDALHAWCDVRADVHPPAWIDNPHPNVEPNDLIAFPNGLLQISKRKLHKATPGYFTLNGLDFDYNPSPPKPKRWLQFLDELLPGDEEAHQLIHEWFGYMLIPVEKYQKQLWISGRPRSGKGEIARTLNSLVGPRNYCALKLSALNNDFGEQTFIGKTTVVLSDARIGHSVDSVRIVETLLTRTGNDQTAINRKGMAFYQGTVNARFTVLMNEPPILKDNTGALNARLLMIQLKNTFLGREDTELTSKLHAERAGILALALDGLDRLTKRGHFVQPASGLEELGKMERLSSPLKCFIQDRCLVAEGLEVSRTGLYNQWCAWCKDNNRHATSPEVFGRDLHSAIPHLLSRNVRLPGNRRERVYVGIDLAEGEGRVRRAANTGRPRPSLRVVK